MKKALLLLVFAAPLMAQDAPKRLVEGPLKPGPAAPEKFDLSKSGIEWHKGLKSALHKRKPILLFQLLGNLDDVYC